MEEQTERECKSVVRKDAASLTNVCAFVGIMNTGSRCDSDESTKKTQRSVYSLTGTFVTAGMVVLKACAM